MKKVIIMLLAMMLLLTACEKKAEEPSGSEPIPSESETMPSESESDTEGATEADNTETDFAYAKELTPVKEVEDPTYRIEGYYSTPSEAFAGYHILHGYSPVAADMMVAIDGVLPDDLTKDYRTDENGEPSYRTEEERKYIDHLSPDSVIFKDDVKIPSVYVIEPDEDTAVLVELLAITDGDVIEDIDYYFTKVFAHGKLIDISEYLVYVRYLRMAGTFFEYQGESVYVEVFGSGRLKITEDDISFAEGYWDYFYDEEGGQMIVYDEYGQKIIWGFHPGKRSEDWFDNPTYPIDITLPYWD